MKTCPNCKTNQFSYVDDHITEKFIDSEGNIQLKVVVSCNNPNNPFCLWGYLATFREVKTRK